MPYTDKFIEATLRSQDIEYDPEAIYIIETHGGVASRLLEGDHEVVAEIPDFSPNERNTMVLLRYTGKRREIKEVKGVLHS